MNRPRQQSGSLRLVPPTVASYVQRIHRILCILWAIGFALLPTCLFGQADTKDESIAVENLWPSDVTIEDAPPQPMIESAFTELWAAALEHDETDLKQELISLMEQLHRKGIDQSEQTKFIRGLVKESNHHTVNVALASLLVALDDEASGKLLFEMIQPNQIEISQIVEPALAKWNYSPAIELWRKRLKDPRVRRTHLQLAIEGLGNVKDQTSFDSLLAIATDVFYERPSIRLGAARAAGAIGGDGLVERCVDLSKSESASRTLNHLCCIALLANQDSDESVSLLQELMVSKSGAVSGAAWERMIEIDSAKALPFTEQSVGSEDPIVRQAVVTTWLEQPTVERIDLIGGLLNDRHPDVRVAARIALWRLANRNEQFDRRVRDVAMKVVTARASNFGGLEQSLLLLTALDHKPVAERAVELLAHKHPNVFVTAAWALRRLKVEEMNKGMLRWATRTGDQEISKFRSGRRVSLHHLDQVAHLFDAFGEAEYGDAEDLLRKFIMLVPDPRDTTNPTGVGPNCRAAAITALGKLYRDNPDRGLVQQFVGRMNARGRAGGYDVPEMWSTTAIALGRMNAKSEIDELRKYYTGGPPVDGSNYASAWALRELTGEEFPPPVPRIILESKFDLKPIGSRIESAEGGTSR